MRWLLLLGLSSLSGCLFGDEVCTGEVALMHVDVEGVLPDGGAITITATNLDNGRVMNVTHFYVSEDQVGGGTVRVVATQAARTSAPVDVEWACGDCNCIPAREHITIVLPE